MNRYRMLFVQTSILPSRMHPKLTKHGRFGKQHLTKSHDELENNSIMQVVGVVFKNNNNNKI